MKNGNGGGSPKGKDGASKAYIELYDSDVHDWASHFGKKDESIETKVLTGFYRLEAAHREHIHSLKEAHREEIEELEAKVSAAERKFEKHEWGHEQSDGALVRYQDKTDESLDVVRKGGSFKANVAIGISTLSLMLVGGFEVEEYAHEDSKAELVEQLKARVESYDSLMQAREKQLDRYMFSENDKFGALLKAVDGLKAQTAEMQWFVNEDTRGMFKEIKAFMDALESKTNTESGD